MEESLREKNAPPNIFCCAATFGIVATRRNLWDRAPMTLDSSWYTEANPEAGIAFSLKVRAKLHDERSAYQRIEVYDTETFGRLMTLDGLVMLTERDNFIYHEMMAHPALYTHPDPRRVLIVGGGDCGTLREVLRHASVERAEQVELDERVTRVSERFFPELCSANGDARARLHFADGIDWVARAAPGAYDVIIVDSTDPIGPAVGLFSEAFYRDCFRALAPDGVLAVQSESPLLHLALIRRVRAALAGTGFAHVATLHFPLCSYPSGWWSATLGSKRVEPGRFREHAARAAPFDTRYYTADVHRGALALPRFFQTP